MYVCFCVNVFTYTGSFTTIYGICGVHTHMLYTYVYVSLCIGRPPSLPRLFWTDLDTAIFRPEVPLAHFFAAQSTAHLIVPQDRGGRSGPHAWLPPSDFHCNSASQTMLSLSASGGCDLQNRGLIRKRVSTAVGQCPDCSTYHRKYLIARHTL